MKSQPTIRVFCTVDPAELQSTGNGAYCNKCGKHLDDITNPDTGLNRSSCGFIKRMIAPAIGSSLALTGCMSNHDGQVPDVTQNAQNNNYWNKEIISVGMYYSDEQLIPEDFPVAKISHENGIVISPYTGNKIDVSGIPPNTLVADPAYKIKDRKYFRLPEYIMQGD